MAAGVGEERDRGDDFGEDYVVLSEEEMPAGQSMETAPAAAAGMPPVTATTTSASVQPAAAAAAIIGVFAPGIVYLALPTNMLLRGPCKGSAFQHYQTSGGLERCWKHSEPLETTWA